MKRTDIAVVGAGRIGTTIAELLARCGDYGVTLVDRHRAQLDRVKANARIETASLDLQAEGNALDEKLRGKFAVLSAAPFRLTRQIAESARRVGAHYIDLTEDVASARHVQQLAEGATTAFVTQCGLAPGFVSIVAHDMVQRFELLDSIRLRVGALPRFPSNVLKYSLTWSTDGVINEYCEPCEAIVGGARQLVPALEDLEELTLDGTVYEAFNTSGGLGTLCDTYLGRVRELNYRTIRYPGHAAIMKVLLDDLRLSERRDVLKDILERALPTTTQDVVVIAVTIRGRRRGALVQETYANTIHGSEIDGQLRSAIQITTAASACAVLDLLVTGKIPGQGLRTTGGHRTRRLPVEPVRAALRRPTRSACDDAGE